METVTVSSVWLQLNRGVIIVSRCRCQPRRDDDMLCVVYPEPEYLVFLFLGAVLSDDQNVSGG